MYSATITYKYLPGTKCRSLNLFNSCSDNLVALTSFLMSVSHIGDEATSAGHDFTASNVASLMSVKMNKCYQNVEMISTAFLRIYL